MSTMNKPSHLCILAVAVSGFASACSDDDLDVYDPAIGTVEFSWTIQGQTDASSCETLGAEAFEVALLDDGFLVQEFEIPCEQFSGRVDVAVDDYVARTTLVDEQDFPVTQRIASSIFTVLEGETEAVSVDFPESSFMD